MAKPRQVRNLQWARLEEEGPFGVQPKARGRAAEGHRYQRKVHETLQPLSRFGPLHDGPWIRFADTYGTHWCQPDHVLVASDRVVVVESKLSQRRLDTALVQLTKLYRPTLEYIFQKPIAMLIAFRHWLPGKGDDLHMVEEPEDVLYYPIRNLAQPAGWHLL